MPGRAPPEAPRAALFLAAVLASLPTRPAQGEEDTELSGDVPPGTEGLDEESEALSTLASVTTEPYITSINSTLVDEDTDQLEFILMVLIPVILLSLLLLSAILLVIYHKRKRNKQEPSSQGSQSVLQTRKIKLSYWVRPACCLESSQRNVLWQSKCPEESGVCRKLQILAQEWEDTTYSPSEGSSDGVKLATVPGFPGPIFEEDTPSVMEIEMEELDKWMNSMNRNADYECLPTLEEEKEPNHNNPSDNES